jgi:putative SOS response-associated peptidase YedK
MCGRFSLTTPAAQIAELFQVTDVSAVAPRYNIPPSGQVLAVRRLPERAGPELVPLRWGFIPAWAKDPAIGNRLVNARSETAAEKPSFREAFRRRRCLIPADGFYEWKKTGGRKEPYYVRLRDGGLFSFAGLWERWRGDDGDAVETCTILTTDANGIVRPIHDRMPVIMDSADYGRWLDPRVQDPEAVKALLRTYPAERMLAYPVSRAVNDPGRDDRKCTEPEDAATVRASSPGPERLLF